MLGTRGGRPPPNQSKRPARSPPGLLTGLGLGPDVCGLVSVNGHRHDVRGAAGQTRVHAHSCGENRPGVIRPGRGLSSHWTQNSGGKTGLPHSLCTGSGAGTADLRPNTCSQKRVFLVTFFSSSASVCVSAVCVQPGGAPRWGTAAVAHVRSALLLPRVPGDRSVSLRGAGVLTCEVPSPHEERQVLQRGRG